MAAAANYPKAWLLMGLLLATFLFLSSDHTIDAAEEHKTAEGTVKEAAKDAVIGSEQADAAQGGEVIDDNKQAYCGGGGCCRWYRDANFVLRCARCCVAGAVADPVDDNKQVCREGQYCCVWNFGFVHCIRCCG